MARKRFSTGGQTELRRLISANAGPLERRYQIKVESTVIGGANPKDGEALDKRPPKPPLDDATLLVRGKNEFVLIRRLPNGRSFVTGCNGKTSWMVPPDGDVHVSSDLQRFNRDVPGHEHSMSLCHLDEALTQLHTAYELVSISPEPVDAKEIQEEPTRLLVATKKRGFPGPRRVEITYHATSGFIKHIRFVDMPYGTDRLTLAMTLIENLSMDTHDFQHDSYHTADREIIEE